MQQQLQAAAARGQQANITPEQIQQQATLMVQAAAQAQAVVAAAKSRGGGLQPMNAAQILALSEVQAKAIVNARQKSMNNNNNNNNNATPSTQQQQQQQIQSSIQLQQQALVHAHTQAQIAAGIYKGDNSSNNNNNNTKSKSVGDVLSSGIITAPPTTNPLPTPTTTISNKTTTTPTTMTMAVNKNSSESGSLVGSTGAVTTMTTAPAAAPAASTPAAAANTSDAIVPLGEDGLPQLSSTSPQFIAQLNGALQKFWTHALNDINSLSNATQTEQDFKNHNDLPLARIKRIMKSDEDVRMISAEAPVLFAKACELFILDLSIRSWNYSQLHKRRTLTKEDVREAIQKTDIFDFLVDVIQ